MSDAVLTLLMGSMVAVVIALVIAVLLVVANWKIFTKAGEAGWKSIIPIYNGYILYKISWKTSMFWIALALALVGGGMTGVESSVASLIGNLLILAAYVIELIQMYKLSKAFGHGIGYVIGMIFLPNVFTLILGFGKDEYQGPQA